MDTLRLCHVFLARLVCAIKVSIRTSNVLGELFDGDPTAFLFQKGRVGHDG